MDFSDASLDEYFKGIERENPDAVGLVILFLDCGCVKAVPLTVQGKIAGDAALISSKPESGPEACQICLRDRGGNPSRVKDAGIKFLESRRLSQEERERFAEAVSRGGKHLRIVGNGGEEAN